MVFINKEKKKITTFLRFIYPEPVYMIKKISCKNNHVLFLNPILGKGAYEAVLIRASSV